MSGAVCVSFHGATIVAANGSVSETLEGIRREDTVRVFTKVSYKGGREGVSEWVGGRVREEGRE